VATLLGIHLTGEMTAGELAVAVGTLMLAGFTGWLAFGTRREARLAEQGLALTRESIEATETPFLVMTPDPDDRAIDLSADGSDDPDWYLLVKFENPGKGPAIVDQISVRDSEGNELVTTDRYRESIYRPGESSPDMAIVLGNLDELPGVGGRFEVRAYYRSVSGARYVTLHRLEVGERQRVARLDFLRWRVAPARPNLETTLPKDEGPVPSP
jgi:hypothetical protein